MRLQVALPPQGALTKPRDPGLCCLTPLAYQNPIWLQGECLLLEYAEGVTEQSPGSRGLASAPWEGEKGGIPGSWPCPFGMLGILGARGSSSTKTCRRTCAIPEQTGQGAGADEAKAVSVAEEIARTRAAKATTKRSFSHFPDTVCGEIATNEKNLRLSPCVDLTSASTITFPASRFPPGPR